jgi:protein-S-isoprenylcysteine O-methyltransferase Ste14
MTGNTVARVASSAALVLLFAGFAAANLMSWHKTGRPVGIGTTVLEAFTACLFIVRKPARITSQRLAAWIAAPIGTFGMLLARPIPSPHSGPAGLAELIQLCGVALALAALAGLGRSFALVAADRGLKTGGLYRLVRHPVYAAYLVAYLGYVAENPSARNVALLAVATSAQLVRIHEEERVLGSEPAYSTYRTRVRYRLLPYVY